MAELNDLADRPLGQPSDPNSHTGRVERWLAEEREAHRLTRERLQQLLDAIGDPEGLRYEADCYEDAAGDLAQIVRRIADVIEEGS